MGSEQSQYSSGVKAGNVSGSCNGLQSKWLRTAINGNLRPDYLHLSIPSGRDYLPLRLLLSSWDCNQRRWDHIKCDSPNHRLRPIFMRGEAYASLENALEVLLSRTSLDLGPRVSHHTSNHPIETQKLSPLLCPMRVYLTKTGDVRSRTGWLPFCARSVADNVIRERYIAVRGK
jgi:hypothetical protein